MNDIKKFFLRWYGPNNATLTVGGDVKTADVVKLLEKYFGYIPAGPAVQKTILPSVKIESDRYVSYTDTYAGCRFYPKPLQRFPTTIRIWERSPAWHKYWDKGKSPSFTSKW